LSSAESIDIEYEKIDSIEKNGENKRGIGLHAHTHTHAAISFFIEIRR
jgi:hypothetical protein